MKKKVSQLVKGDVIRVEYGDSDNWATVIVQSIEMEKGIKLYDCKMNCIGYHNPKVVCEMYSKSKDYIYVIKNIYDEK